MLRPHRRPVYTAPGADVLLAMDIAFMMGMR